MFTYFFYIGGMVIVGAVICSVLFMGFRDAPEWARGRAGMTALVILCAASMLGLPYAGWSHAARSRDITKRNNEFAALEAEIIKNHFDQQCTFNGYRTSSRTSPDNSFPCIQRGDIRVVSNPFRSGMTYFIVDRANTPERWKGMVDYPIPFSFPHERKLLDAERVRATFMTGAGEPSPAPIIAGE